MDEEERLKAVTLSIPKRIYVVHRIWAGTDVVEFSGKNSLLSGKNSLVSGKKSFWRGKRGGGRMELNRKCGVVGTEYKLVVQPEMEESSRRRADYIVLQEAEPDVIKTVAWVLAQTVALHFYETCVPERPLA